MFLGRQRPDTGPNIRLTEAVRPAGGKLAMSTDIIERVSYDGSLESLRSKSGEVRQQNDWSTRSMYVVNEVMADEGVSMVISSRRLFLRPNALCVDCVGKRHVWHLSNDGQSLGPLCLERDRHRQGSYPQCLLPGHLVLEH